MRSRTRRLGESGQALTETVLAFTFFFIPLAMGYSLLSEVQIHARQAGEAARFACWEWSIPGATFSEADGSAEMNQKLAETFEDRNGEFRVTRFENANPLGDGVVGTALGTLAFAFDLGGHITYEVEHTYEPEFGYYLTDLFPDGLEEISVESSYVLQTNGWAADPSVPDGEDVEDMVRRIQTFGLSDVWLIGDVMDFLDWIGLPLTPFDIDVPDA